jgi:hypothetical protein
VCQPGDGSFTRGPERLNHRWLIAAATPMWTGAPADQHSIIDSNGMPNTSPLYTPTGPVLDRALTQTCPSAVPGRASNVFDAKQYEAAK